jgi:uncharacterized protein YdaT
MCFFWRKKKKALKEEKVVQEQQVEPVQEAPVTPPQEAPQKVEPKVEPVVKNEVPKEPAKVVKEEPVIVQNEAEDVQEVTENSKKTAPKIAKYHVSQNKDENSDSFKKWRVRKEGSTKTIKFFDTQKEAIEYAEQLAESAGSSVVIHKVDGSIRKQDYTKK